VDVGALVDASVASAPVAATAGVVAFVVTVGALGCTGACPARAAAVSASCLATAARASCVGLKNPVAFARTATNPSIALHLLLHPHVQPAVVPLPSVSLLAAIVRRGAARIAICRRRLTRE